MYERFWGVLTYDIQNRHSAQETHVKTMISVPHFSANVFMEANFLGVKTKVMIPVWRFSMFLDKKEPPVSPTDMMKFANFLSLFLNKSFVFRRFRKENILLIVEEQFSFLFNYVMAL